MVNQLPLAITQEAKHLEIPLAKQLSTNHTVFIRSQLGTGKSHQVAKLLSDYTGKVVIVSHRKTFTSDVSKRYECVSYEDITGPVDMNTTRRVIVQVESLHRLRNYSGSLLIIDECESILSQMTNHVANRSKSHRCLINLLAESINCIVMDGLL